MKMVERSKTWTKDNILSLIIIAMFTAFWVQYQSDRIINNEAHEKLLTTNSKFNSRQLTVCTILINDPDTDPYYREILKEWVKMETRGGHY